jgi:hypothetical protein
MKIIIGVIFFFKNLNMRKNMITNLQINETKLVAGGGPFSNVGRRLNKLIGKPLERAAQAANNVVGKPLEKVAQAVGNVLKDIKVTVAVDENGQGGFNMRIESK